MVEGNAKATESADTRIIASYKAVAKPLDFSFLKIDNIHKLKQELPRSGKRKPVIESDDEEESKKNENVVASTEEKHEDIKEKEKERIVKAPQTSQIAVILATNNVSLTNNKNTFAGRKNEDTKVEAKKKIVVQEETVTLFLQ